MRSQVNSIYVERWRKRNRAKYNEYMLDYKYKKYGITYKEIQEEKAKRNNKCDICSEVFSPKDLHVDHCHSSMKYRGILCRRCNSSLGWYETHIDKIREYLEK